MNLIVINYSMSNKSMLFSHQREVVKRLTGYFGEVVVVTADEDKGAPISNVRIISTNWKSGSRFISSVRFMRKILPLLFKKRNSVIFSHMTEVQSAIIAPVCKLLKIRHYLWYAHNSKSIYLRWNLFFVSAIISSTPGSCPVSSKKLHLIGQGISTERYSDIATDCHLSFLRWYHVSRIDSSKKIELLIEAVQSLRIRGYKLNLDIFGLPSGVEQVRYYEWLKVRYSEFLRLGWLNFCGILHPEVYRETLSRYGGFIHAFQGSLDKTLVEATLGRKFVVTLNHEYRREFGLNPGHKESELETLVNELKEVMLMTPSQRKSEIDRRWEIANSKHSLDGWINRLSDILKK